MAMNSATVTALIITVEQGEKGNEVRLNGELIYIGTNWTKPWQDRERAVEVLAELVRERIGWTPEEGES